MDAWTDYPKPGEHYDRKAMRRVKIEGFDGDKYCRVSTGEVIKCGYMFRSRRRVAYRWPTFCRRLSVLGIDEMHGTTP